MMGGWNRGGKLLLLGVICVTPWLLLLTRLQPKECQQQPCEKNQGDGLDRGRPSPSSLLYSAYGEDHRGRFCDSCNDNNSTNKTSLASRLFMAGMNEQRRLGFPIYRLEDGQPDYKTMWEHFADNIDAAWGIAKHNPAFPQIEHIDGDFFINFLSAATATTNATSTADCHVVTIGVGKTIVSETAFKQRYPHCYFLGVDPDEENNRQLFEEGLGKRAKFVKGALNRKTGLYKGSFLTEGDADTGKYEEREVQQMGFGDFLHEHFAGGEMIDLMNIDAEGAEYPIIEWLLENNSTSSPVICQMNIEMHPLHSSWNQTYERFFLNFDAMLKRYALLNHSTEWSRRAYFFNISDQKCLAKIMNAVNK